MNCLQLPLQFTCQNGKGLKRQDLWMRPGFRAETDMSPDYDSCRYSVTMPQRFMRTYKFCRGMPLMRAASETLPPAASRMPFR